MHSAWNRAWHIVSSFCVFAVFMIMGDGDGDNDDLSRDPFREGARIVLCWIQVWTEGGDCVFTKWGSLMTCPDVHGPAVVLASVTQSKLFTLVVHILCSTGHYTG